MSTTQHPLTDTAAAEMWDASPRPDGCVFRGMLAEEQHATVHAMRAAFNAGREHEREHAAQDPLTDETLDRLVSYISGGTIDCSTHEGQYDSLSEDDARTLVESLWEPMTQAALSAALAVAAPAEPLARTLLAVPEGYGAPHHDAGRIKPGDFVAQVDESGLIRSGRVNYQDERGDWFTEGGRWITNAAWRANRPDAVTVWPAPTPPAVEVEMPGEDGAILLDVEALDPATDDVHRSNKTVYLYGRWFGIDSHTVEEIRIWPTWITAFTLPDGTRARRDGERPDGEPRFVKVQEEEK